jgi:hypothetical protein
MRQHRLWGLNGRSRCGTALVAQLFNRPRSSSRLLACHSSSLRTSYNARVFDLDDSRDSVVIGYVGRRAGHYASAMCARLRESGCDEGRV